MHPYHRPHIYGPSDGAGPSSSSPARHLLHQWVSSPPVAIPEDIVSGHMNRTTDRPNVFLDSSNLPVGSYSPFCSLSPDVAGPSSSSSSSLPQLPKANAVRYPMARPATKTGPVPIHPYTYVSTANPIQPLPYAIYPAHTHAMTPVYHASKWPMPQPTLSLPRGGAPARPPQRLHSFRMQPFPSRLKAGAVPSERQDPRRDGGLPHFHTAPYQSGLMRAPTCPVGIPPVPGKGPPVLQNTQNPLFVVPTVSTFFVPPQLPVFDPISFCLPQPPLLVAPRVTFLQHAGVTFTVSHLLGEGSAGRVVLGENAGRLYAIKVIHPRRARKTHSHRSNFLRERAFMIKVGSSESTRRFFVPLLMAWEEDGYKDQARMFFVMPLHPMDMHAALSTRQPMSLKDRYLYCQELICALCALRQLGIIHKDIKPGNILINAQGRAVISDFGLAEEVPLGQYDTWQGTFCAGTYAYMAPEMVCNIGWGSGVDVWSMGLAFLQILDFVPKRYFVSESLEAIRAEHATLLPIHFEVPQNFDVAFAKIVQMMLHVDPAQRMTVRQLDSIYASSSSWSKVRNGLAPHDWIPTVQSSRMRPVGQCLDFHTFRTSEPSGLGGVHASSTAGLWRADTDQFEYRVPGEFE